MIPVIYSPLPAAQKPSFDGAPVSELASTSQSVQQLGDRLFKATLEKEQACLREQSLQQQLREVRQEVQRYEQQEQVGKEERAALVQQLNLAREREHLLTEQLNKALEHVTALCGRVDQLAAQSNQQQHIILETQQQIRHLINQQQTSIIDRIWASIQKSNETNFIVMGIRYFTKE